MVKGFLAVILMFCSVQDVRAATAEPVFTDTDWMAIPEPGDIGIEEVKCLLTGSIQRGGHEWMAVTTWHSEELTAVTADGQFKINQFVTEKWFRHVPFDVDSKGRLRYEISLVSLTHQMQQEGGAVALSARLPIVTQLTAAELSNPIVCAVRSSLTFEDEVQLSRNNPEKYKHTVALDRVRKLSIFATDQQRDKVEAMIQHRVEAMHQRPDDSVLELNAFVN